METIQSPEQFNDVIKTEAVVNFTAPSWCVPCQRLEPHYQAVEDRVDKNLYLVIMDDFSTDFAEEVKVLTVPSVVYYKDGQEVGRLNARTVTQLEEQINSL